MKAAKPFCNPQRTTCYMSMALDVSHATPGELSAGQLTVAGILMHNRKSLEKLLAAGRQLELNVTGILRLSDDVTPELACAVINHSKFAERSRRALR